MNPRLPSRQQCQNCGPFFCVELVRAAEQVAGGSSLGVICRKAQPQSVPGTRQPDIKQSQILAQPFLRHARFRSLVQNQQQFALPPGLGQDTRHVRRLGEPRDPLAVAGQIRQAHHGELQALALVDRDDLDQIGITFQANDLFFPTVGVLGNLVDQPANQRLLAFELTAGRLKQFGQVQKVRQAAFTAVPPQPQPQRRQLKPMQRLAQHGQHALRLPDLVQLMQNLGLVIERVVIGRDLAQPCQRQPKGLQGQACAHQGRIVGRRHGAQPMHQITRFITAKD